MKLINQIELRNTVYEQYVENSLIKIILNSQIS